jgi:hypothetical protein
MKKTNEKDNVISMLSGFTGDISSVGWVQIPPPADWARTFNPALS